MTNVAAVVIRKVAQLGEPVLRQDAAPITREQLASQWLQRLVADMTTTMRDAEGAGLSAPQVYEPFQLCMVEVNKNARYPTFPEIPFRVFINPKLTPIVQSHDVLVESDSITLYEGCLSIPGLRGQVTRPRRVRVQALDLEGRAIDETWEGVAAAIIQHEVDHLHGTLFIDRADPRTLCFQKEFERHVPKDEHCVDLGEA
ncbi:MAG: peptide deformylase [Pseudomonadota bacterium]|jgi:peptide deformylase